MRETGLGWHGSSSVTKHGVEGFVEHKAAEVAASCRPARELNP